MCEFRYNPRNREQTASPLAQESKVFGKLAGNALVPGKSGAGQSALERILGQVYLLHCPK